MFQTHQQVDDLTEILSPGATIGILGGGQLGRMIVLAAAQLGYKCHIFSPEPEAPAKDVSAATTTAPYDDPEALRAFAENSDVITFEFENIPDKSLELIADLAPIRPGVQALRISQDRSLEKSFLNEQCISTVAWSSITEAEKLDQAAAITGLPAILKSSRFGYDGKGQSTVTTIPNLQEAWTKMGGVPCVLEQICAFEREISVVVTRAADGQTEHYVPVDNVHRNKILHTSTAPTKLDQNTANEAVHIAKKVAEAIELIGLVAVEMFVLNNKEILVNEIAPRPHNSGHWTMDACLVSQFEQLVRAIVGLPLGRTKRHSNAVMTNLIGDDVESWYENLSDANSCLHLYGKKEPRKGRKMGHVTRLFPLEGLA
ncbi:MAG: 5-(carboxyamino)imidazole ribonucleotide synthase [Pseudomonadota bacterium]|nr:5-(carboxyamino)imidazole ribonucleotide synthase [Pseudomonadota bacterium]